jgi:DNA-binding transcriptional ArsR family regulator
MAVGIYRVRNETMATAEIGGIEREAELLRALAHPVRLDILETLSRDEECVCHLAALLKRPQPYVSKQLAELREVGLVVDRRDAQRVYYRLAEPRVAELLVVARSLSGRSASVARQPIPGCACPRCA